MHPILADRGSFVLYLFVFMVFGFLLAAFIAASGAIEWGAAIAFSVPMAFIFALVSLSSWYICRSFPLRSTGTAQLLAVFILAAIFSSSLWVLIGGAIVSILTGFSFAVSLANRSTSQILLLFGTGFGLYLLSVAVHYLMITFDESKEAERRTLEMKILAQSAELKALRSQINPHFLFNSLNSISALTTKDPTAARSMLLLLSDFLRLTLNVGSTELITLHDEITFCRKFLDIEQVRFGPRLRITQTIAESAANLLIPPLLLQPLIENAVLHGIAHLVDGGTITLVAEKRGERLIITVKNPCDPDRPGKKGSNLGLENVRRRLRTISEIETRLDVSELGGIFTVELVLPAIA